jgi:glutamine---fructose-6-phosphate transaminase (isomerizing)
MTVTATHLYREIHEQPAVLDQLLSQERQTAQAVADAIRARDISHVIIAARGTSDNAARYAQYLLGTTNGLPVALALPSQFTLYKQPPRFGNALVIGISQSGKSPDIVAVLEEARRQNALTLVITNNTESDLAAQGDFVIPLHAGIEQAVAATKSYTAELGALALISALLADAPSMLDALNRAPELMSETLEVEARVVDIVQRYRYMSRAVVIGRGYNLATAFELALKLKELTYKVIEPYSSADFLHGPLAIIEPGFPVIVIAASGPLLGEMQDFIRAITERKAEVLCISNDVETRKLTTPLSLSVPAAVPEWLSPLTTIIPGQLLGMHLADICGYNVDYPRSIQKVTETH